MLALLNKLMYTLICCDGYDIANNKYGPLAHLVEHLTLNQGVRGSSPRRPTTKVLIWQIFEAAGLGLFFGLRVYILIKRKLPETYGYLLSGRKISYMIQVVLFFSGMITVTE